LNFHKQNPTWVFRVPAAWYWHPELTVLDTGLLLAMAQLVQVDHKVL